MKKPLRFKRGTILKNNRSGENVIFLGMVDGCFHVWHHLFKDCYFSAESIINKWKVVQ